MSTFLRVAIDARLSPGGIAGGVEQFVMGLVYALGQINSNDEEYIIITHWKESDWLTPYLGSNQSIVYGDRPKIPHRAFLSIKHLWKHFHSPGKRLWQRLRPFVFPSPTTIPSSEGFYETLGVDVVHFPRQRLLQTDLPIIFNPHDLQHIHFPQFFSQNELNWRDFLYQYGCHRSRAIVAESKWSREDIINQYSISPEKIYTIYMGAPTELYDPLKSDDFLEIKLKYRLPQTFAFYPAQTFPHKNHIRLMNAIKILRDRHGVLINLVCTGKQNDHWPNIKKHVLKLKLKKQVHFLGFVEPSELRALYHMAKFVVFPSLFEGGGFPILEAFQEGTPITCSAVTSIPEYGGDAFLPFNPNSVGSIAQAILRMNEDKILRKKLIQRGAERIRYFKWQHMAQLYRVLYHKVAGHPLSYKDNLLLKSTRDS